MDTKQMNLTVLARIPDLSLKAACSERMRSRPERVIGQSLSLKVLGVGIVVLLGLALFSTRTPTPIASNSPTALSVNPAVECKDAIASRVETAPDAVSIQEKPFGVQPLPCLVSQPAMPSYSPFGGTQAAALPQVSEWPNPVHPISEQVEATAEQPSVGVNQAMAIRPLEHVRSSNDGTGSSIH